MDFDGVEKVFPVVCAPCSAKIRAEEAEQEDARRALERKIQADRLFAESMVGSRLKSATFETWKHRKGTERMLEAAKNWASFWDAGDNNGNGLILIGPVGTGKSHLAAACVHHVLGRMRAAVFADTMQLMDRLNATYDDHKETENQVLGTLAKADLVVLDDVGARRWTESQRDRIGRVINDRYNARLPIIVTTNLDINPLAGYVGDRSIDRLLETCDVVKTDATSYRREMARARISQ